MKNPIRYLLLLNLCLPVVICAQWNVIEEGGLDVYANYTYPHPGSLSFHSMNIDSTGKYLYLFGGYGFSFIPCL